MFRDASFREKSAWISFVLILVASAVYFTHAAIALAAGDEGPLSFHLFLALVILVALLEVVLHALLRRQAPHEARTPRDERERLIATQATASAYWVLLVGAFATIVAMHVTRDIPALIHVLAFAIVVAELAKFGRVIALYRRSR